MKNRSSICKQNLILDKKLAGKWIQMSFHHKWEKLLIQARKFGENFLLAEYV